MSAPIEALLSPDAGPPGAYYSQAVRAGDRVWTAGAVGTEPSTGRVAPGGVEPQIHRAIQNIRATLAEAGTDLAHVVKTTCFVTRREDFALLDPIYRQYFPDPPVHGKLRAAKSCALPRRSPTRRGRGPR